MAPEETNFRVDKRFAGASGQYSTLVSLTAVSQCLDLGIWIVPLCLASSGPRPVPVITRGVERSTRSVNRARLYAMCSVDPESIRNSLARPMVRVFVAIRLVAVVSGWSSGDW